MTQKETVLRMLREAGPKGVSAHVWNFEYGITRSAAIVHELRQEGHDIRTVDEGRMRDGRQRMARYVLHADAGRPTAPAAMTDEAKGPDLPAVALRFPCGCTRAADGRGWASRCANHAKSAVTV